MKCYAFCYSHHFWEYQSVDIAWILCGYCVDIALWQSDVTNGLLKLGLDLQALANEQNGQDIIIFFSKDKLRVLKYVVIK
uniref:Uncharacterized protein n=1 Tax=Rhizophagus irregularis (strain DAOM 181602 / DAOM 197198 / MUCL 43194) TaxID=747089 RepID=U9TCZ8_RHIID